MLFNESVISFHLRDGLILPLFRSCELNSLLEKCLSLAFVITRTEVLRATRGDIKLGSVIIISCVRVIGSDHGRTEQ
jgi:hypothetical protein